MDNDAQITFPSPLFTENKFLSLIVNGPADDDEAAVYAALNQYLAGEEALAAALSLEGSSVSSPKGFLYTEHRAVYRRLKN